MTVATTGSYRHRTWDQDMADAILTAAAIYRNGELMTATLKAKKAGRTHLDLVEKSQAEGLELVQEGARILIKFDKKYEGILKSVLDMGGSAEVAQRNDYHQN
jgi:hypothetical protein